MDFLNGLYDALSSVGAELSQIFAYLVNLIVQVFQFLWTALVDIFNFFWAIVQAVGKFLSHIWTNFFKAIWTKALKYLQAAHRWLEAKLAPVLKILRNILARIDYNYKHFIRPLLNMLQKIRQVLLILRLMHIGFAKQLDRYILELEQKLTKAFLTTRGIFTSLINVVNAVIDAPMLLRKPIMVLSLRRTFYSVIRAFTGLPVSYFFPSDSPKAPRGLKVPPVGHSFFEDEYNPPASYYLGLDGGLGDFSGFDPTEIPSDDFADVVKPLDSFQEDEEEIPVCLDIADCLRQAIEQATYKRLLDVPSH
jgi:hypothetical protein